MGKCKNQRVSDRLTEFLLKLNKGQENETLRKQANQLISNLTPDDVARAEKKLAESGLSLKKIQQLSSAFILMGILDESGIDLRKQLPPSHILRKIMAEHEVILCLIADLEDVAMQIQQKTGLTSLNSEFMRLTHIIEHLNALKEHLDRENDVVFPALKSYGWQSLFDHLEREHTYIQMSIHELVKLILAFEQMPFSNFKTRLLAGVRYVCPLLRDHLRHENQALFPLAFSAIQDRNVWERLRRICNELGYCGLHP